MTKEKTEFPDVWQREKLKKFIEEADEMIFFAQAQIRFFAKKYLDTKNEQFLAATKQLTELINQKAEWKKYLAEEYAKTP